MDGETVVSVEQATRAEVTYTNEVTQVPTVGNEGRLHRPFMVFERIMNIFETCT
jgi:hypothetical protein